MNKKITLIVILIISMVSFQNSIAQVKEFTTDRLKFPDQLQDYFKAEQSDEGNDAAGILKNAWKAGNLSAEKEQVIMAFANKMLSKKIKATPEFKNYIIGINNFSKAQINDATFKIYFAILDKLVEQKKQRDFTNFLEFAIYLFDGNHLFLEPGSKWFIENNDYTLVNDSIPYLIINNKNLHCDARGDKINIYNTSGIYYPLKKMWVGNKGLINWSRAGLDSTQIFAQLNKYSINVNLSEFKADSVIYTNKLLFANPLKGSLEDKCTPNNNPETATYPKFSSYQKEFFIKNLFKNINYNGGFSMEGNKAIGIGDKGKDATISIYLGDTLAMKISSKGFSIYPDRIISLDAEVTIFLGEKDSIYHPACEFKFLANERKVSLLRQKSGIGNTNFYDSFHQLSIEADILNWNMDQPTIEIGMVERQTPREVFFESNNYFREFKYRKVQGIQNYSPLAVLKAIVAKYKTNTFPAKYYSDEVNIREVDCKPQLRQLVELGFILFDEDKNTITVKERAINWVKNSAGTLDYDIIKLTSLIKNNHNATLNIRNLNLEIRGVDKIYLSDSQSVTIYPSEQTISIKGNRNMIFGGQVTAGTLDFYGKGFTFDYENFKIGLLNIDSLTIKVLGKEDARGRKQLINVETVLQNINGDLYIDDKNNKSGVKDFSQYPLFDSKKESFVYFDYPKIQKGLYRRDVFYFRVVPFKIDSLDNLTSTQGLAFPGVMYSGDIFPPFDEVLLLQPDTSLGYVSKTPIQGYPMYGGKGKYTDVIRISSKGFFGSGKIDYLTSTTFSDNYLFFIDSLQTPIKTFDIRKESYKSTKYPQLSSKESYMRWHPYVDSMYVYQRKPEEPMRMYDTKSILDGRIIYTPQNLSGTGLSQIKSANFRSNYFVFDQDKFKADTSKVQIYNPDSTKIAVFSENTSTKVDFIGNTAKFKTNLQGPNIFFPLNIYLTSMDEYQWFFDKNYIDFVFDKSNDVNSVFFRSTKKNQDSLQFNASKSRYFLQHSKMNINGIPSIFVADAEIFPDSNKVEIFPEADMKTLEKAKISANVKTRFHEIYDARLKITGKYNYGGEGSYNYKNKSGDLQTIKFNKINVDTARRTRGISALADTNFRLNPRIFFRGDVVLKAEDRYFNYKGFARIEQYSNVVKSDFFSFEGEVNPDSSTTEIIDPRNQRGERLFIGIHIGNTNNSAYGTFISKKIEPNDLDIFKINGVLQFDTRDREFKIGSKDRLFNGDLKGDYFAFNEVRETIYAEGKFNLGVDFGEGLVFDFRGSATDKLLDESLSFDAVSSFDFKFLDKALSIMTQEIQSSPTEVTPPKNDRPMYIKALTELLDAKTSAKAISDIQLYGSFNKNKIPSDLEHTLNFSELKMEWDKESRSFRSVGPIGVLAFGDKMINRQLKGCLSIVRRKNGDSFNLYLETAPNTWYFFSYTKGLMEAISSNQEFNQLLQIKAKADSPFTISTIKRKTDHVRSFEKE